VASVIDSQGNIESICAALSIRAGDNVTLTFRTLEESDPPYTVKITSPAGKVVLERVLRDLPDGKPQSAPPVSFKPLDEGDYRIDIWQLYGKARGHALLHVRPLGSEPVD
jgi:hypothetical protein